MSLFKTFGAEATLISAAALIICVDIPPPHSESFCHEASLTYFMAKSIRRQCLLLCLSSCYRRSLFRGLKVQVHHSSKEPRIQESADQSLVSLRSCCIVRVSPFAAGFTSVKSAPCITNILIAAVLFGGTMLTNPAPALDAGAYYAFSTDNLNADDDTKLEKVLA